MKFVDIDLSFSIRDNSTPISGYIVCRAPKGETRAMYFGPQNAQAIDAMIGIGSSEWPDIVEAQSFNSEYGLYISAPPGTSDVYPSELGGFYLASSGIHKFYGVTSKEELMPSGEALPPYKVSISPTYENEFDFEVKSSSIELYADLGELPNGAEHPVNGYIRDPEDKTPRLTLFDAKSVVRKVTTVDDDGEETTKDIIGTDTKLVIKNFPRKLLAKTFQIDYDNIIGLNVGITMTSRRDGALNKWLNDETDNLLQVEEVAGSNGSVVDLVFPQFDLSLVLDGMTPAGIIYGGPVFNKLVTEPLSLGKGLGKLLDLIETGFCRTDDNIRYNIGFSIFDVISIVVNIQDDVYAFVMQKSLTERSTNIVISDIGYDKYRYDAVFNYVKVNDFGSLPTPTDDSPTTLAFYMDGAHDSIADIIIATRMTSQGLGKQYADCTSDYATQYITFAHPHNADHLEEQFEDRRLFRKIYYVDNTNIRQVWTEEECILMEEGNLERGKARYIAGLASIIPQVAVKDLYANTFTFSCSEEVYPGRTTGGGSFTGSLDEFGTDSFGSNIFFPNILTDDDFTFVEVRVIKKFGDNVDDWDNGFWTGKRAVDPYDMDMYPGEIPMLAFTIEGNRYTELLMKMNLVEGRLGGAWRTEHFQIIREGLLEALNPEYDDSYVFIEPTGNELFKEMLVSMRKAQEFATIITPFQIPTSAISGSLVTPLGAQRLTVAGRYRGISTWCGEFEVFDPITHKKYWRQPIGDVGSMLARIIDQKLGAWAPAWMNAGVVGGQLKSSVLRSKYSYDDSSIDDKLKVTYILDQKGINPIAFSSDDGLMMLSSKTTEDPNTLSLWSFLENQMAFDLCKREIRDNVMRQQIKKPINAYYMGIRQQQVDAILGKRTSGAQPLWLSATCDVAGANTEVTMRQRKFCIKVHVKPTIFAEFVELELAVSI